MVILVDTNVILDVILMRDEFISDSYRVMRLCYEEASGVEGYAAAHTIPNLWYILRKYFKPVERRENILSSRILKTACRTNARQRSARIIS